jgi:5-(carboxyamino)imidazole ribonucleotide synthase
MFLTKSSELLVNESAPRPHNSGHHTIDSALTSQFEQHLRAICDMPLGSGVQKVPAAVMINLLGEPGQKGPVWYQGAEECLEKEGVNLHLYGKALTAPFRKMGHATIVASSVEKAIETANFVKNQLKVCAAAS